MALTRNGSHQLSGLSRCFGAVGAYGLRSVLENNGNRKNFDSGEHAISNVTNKASIPEGARHPIAWRLPTKPGGLGSHREAEGSSTPSLSLASGWNLIGATTTTSDGSATLQLVVSMAGSVTGVSTVTGNILAALGMVGSSTGSGTATGAINALAWAYGQITGTSTATLTRYATGRLYGAITPYTELSPQSLASAVIDAASTTPIAANIKKVNDYLVTGSGTTGNTWGPA